uniref:hypothetical protein n=1 Tax=Bacteroides fragilis TaxID=817 RepID=UPI003567E2C9
MRYIIDSRYYRGCTVAIMHDDVHNDNDKEETLETLRIRHNNPNLIAITPERLRILNKRYQESIVTPFQEITEERYVTLFNCLLPLRMNQYSFFVGEPNYNDLYSFCFEVNGRFYCGERSIRLSTDELIRLINEHTSKLNYHPALVKGEPYNQYFRWYNREVKRTPYFFTDGQHMKPISTLSSATGNKYDDNRNRRELAKYLRSLRSNCYQYLTYYSREENIFDFFAWLGKNNYTLEIQGSLFYFDENREFADFHGNVWECSAVFSYRIYTREMLQHVINQLRTVKRKHAWKRDK